MHVLRPAVHISFRVQLSDTRVGRPEAFGIQRQIASRASLDQQTGR